MAGSTTPDDGTWIVHHRSGDAGALHALDVLAPAGQVDGALHARRSLWFMQPTEPAVVFGSSQRSRLSSGDVTTEADGPDGRNAAARHVVRRSGGGAVWVDAGCSLWVDVVIGRDDPLWIDDVGRAGLWLGAAWVDALGQLGVHGEVYDGPASRDPLSRAICFAGVGPGEVVADGAKLVGVSQRRTRHGARFQCIAYTQAFDTTPLAAAVAAVVGGVGDVDDLVEVVRRRTGVVTVGHRVLADAFTRVIMSAFP